MGPGQSGTPASRPPGKRSGDHLVLTLFGKLKTGGESPPELGICNWCFWDLSRKQNLPPCALPLPHPPSHPAFWDRRLSITITHIFACFYKNQQRAF